MLNNAEIKATFTNFITKIIVNESIKYKRKNSNIAKREVSICDQIDIYIMPLSNYDDGIFCTQNQTNYLQLENLFTNTEHFKAMQTLSDKQKQILYLSIIEDLSIKKIARKLNITENNVKSTKSQAITRFLKNLKKEDDV